MDTRKVQRNISAVVVCGAMVYLATGISGSLHKHPAYADQPVTECETEATVAEMDYDWYHKDAYFLAKIAMAEAEGEDTVGKALVIRTVLNRVESEKFPNDVEGVLYQKAGNGWQFAPMEIGGRWYTTEPDEDCWEALYMVQTGWDESLGALYFEQAGSTGWHNDNLEFLFQHGGHCFYKEK